MSSLLTNTSAMTALAALTQTQQNLSHTENMVSTGLRISSAADNAAYWSIATKMQSNIGALGAVNDALSESSSIATTMTRRCSKRFLWSETSRMTLSPLRLQAPI